MRKIPTMFVRTESDRARVTDQVTPGCEWVIAGEGVPTRKYDGSCFMFDGEQWWARREVKAGRETPQDFHAIETDGATGKTVGWEPAGASGFKKFFDEALPGDGDVTPGTYELVGPKINGNPESLDRHILVQHARAERFEDVPRDFDGLREWLLAHPYEGIVFHHPDGRMAKIKRRDFRS